MALFIHGQKWFIREIHRDEMRSEQEMETFQLAETCIRHLLDQNISYRDALEVAYMPHISHTQELISQGYPVIKRKQVLHAKELFQDLLTLSLDDTSRPSKECSILCKPTLLCGVC